VLPAGVATISPQHAQPSRAMPNAPFAAVCLWQLSTCACSKILSPQSLITSPTNYNNRLHKSDWMENAATIRHFCHDIATTDAYLASNQVLMK
jgi:hypothetical protein